MNRICGWGWAVASVAAVLGLCLLAMGSAFAASSVELSVVERAGVDRANEPVTSGIPFPQGVLRDAESVRLLRDGKEVPAQFRALGLWPQDKSIRWLLVDTIVDIKAKETQKFVLEYGEGVKAVAAREWPVIDGFWKAVEARQISPRDVEAKDEPATPAEPKMLVNGLPVSPAQFAAARCTLELRGVRPMATRAIPGAKNTGRSHLIYIKLPDRVADEKYVLRFTTDREFELVAAHAGNVGKGTWGQDFTSADGTVVIPRDAWLQYAYPKKGDTYSFAVRAGQEVVRCFSTETKALETGPIRSAGMLRGAFGADGYHVLEFTAICHYYRGGNRLRMLLTLENNNHGGRTNTGNANNANIGGINCVFFDGMVLRQHLPLDKGGKATLGWSAAAEPLVRGLGTPLELYQDSSGGPNWNRYQGEKFHPRPASYVSFKGCKVFEGGKEVAQADRAVGWLAVSDSKMGVTVCVRDFWQNCPKSLAVDKNGVIDAGLFPTQYAGDFALRSGEHKTHEILFQFHEGEAPRDGGRALALAFSEPLRLEPSPEWFARTRALGDLHPADMTNYKASEIRNLSAIGVFPEGVKPGPSIFSRIEEMDFYGWMDWGDVPIDFEAPSGQWGMKYDLDYQMAQQYARTLNPAWWNLFSAAARHTADIDIHHQPHYQGIHFVKGGVWAHSLHDEPGHKNPHRNYNHFTKDLCFGARGTAAYHYLTGDWKAREACLEIADNAFAQYMSPQADPGDPKQNNRMGVRGDACTLNRLLEGYLLTGDQKYLDRARWQVKACAFDGKPEAHKPTSLWSSVFYMMALARYVEICPDDAAARSYLIAHIETLRRGADPANGILYEITPQPDGSVVGKGTCSHYNIMAADALAIGFRLTGDAKYMEAARNCFAYGVRNACWKDGPPTYFHIHSANGATHGNVFMVVDSELRAKGK